MSGDQYRVVLLSKAGVGGAKRDVLERLADTDGIEVAGIVVEDMLHGPLAGYVRTLTDKVVRHRGRGYPVRAYNAGRDVFGTVIGLLSNAGADGPEGAADGGHGSALADVPVVEVSDMLSDHARGQIEALDPDLAIVWGTRVLPPRIFEIPTDGSIGVHAGKIPEYRGGPAGFWELYHGEREAGVTVQELNEELDAGRIVGQVTVPIEHGDSPADVRARQHEITSDLVVDSVVGLADGSIEPREWGGDRRPVNTPPSLLELVRFWIRQRGRSTVSRNVR